METRHAKHRQAQDVSRRELLQAGLAASAAWSTWPLYGPPVVWSAEAGPPKRGGILRARGWDPVHFDPHLTRAFMTHTALSFVYNKLLRHKVGPDVQPGTFIVEPDLAERWKRRTTPPISSICARASNGTISRRSTGANWWPRM